MGREFHIEVDGVEMFSGYDWVDLGDECTHECEHRSLSVIAWGPTRSLYELIRCDDCMCRSWRDGRAYEYKDINPTEAKFWKKNMTWRELNYHGREGPPTGERS